MSSAMLMERVGMGTSGLASPGYGSPTPSSMPGMSNFVVLPRCEMKFEKCTGGFKITCSCEDEVACGALQNLCKMLAGGMCSCCCTYNGITICQCNFCCGNCKCEYTKDGCCLTCTSGDKACCDMLQACCDCLKCCYEKNCCCYFMFNNTPVCCGSC